MVLSLVVSLVLVNQTKLFGNRPSVLIRIKGTANTRVSACNFGTLRYMIYAQRDTKLGVSWLKRAVLGYIATIKSPRGSQEIMDERSPVPL